MKNPPTLADACIATTLRGAGAARTIVRELQRDGYSMRGIAAELGRRRVPTPRGGSWHPQLVKRIVQRLDADQAA
jgi:hypothetical protein